MSSIRTKIIRSVTGTYVRRVDVSNADFKKIRRLWNWLGGLMITAFGVRVEADEINGLHAEWLTPKNHIEGK